MTIERSGDNRYPYTICGGWGDKVYCSLDSLKELRKEIDKILKEEAKNQK